HVTWGINDAVPGIDYSQALTDTVEYFAPPVAKVEIVITNRNDNSQRKILLKSTRVRVKVHNMQSGVNSCKDKSPHDASCRPHHFRAYYELLEKDPGHYPHPGAMFLCENHFEVKTDP